jgi:hypothetical protein
MATPETMDKVTLPQFGYDASLCPMCAESGLVQRHCPQDTEDWLLRGRVCKACGYSWMTVELYVTTKKSGRPPKGYINLRRVGLSVDALEDGETGPQAADERGENHE